jgi:hypothetical protein
MAIPAGSAVIHLFRPHTILVMTGVAPTDKVVARLASGAQLWRLNELGILGEALKVEERVSADRAGELLREAAARGLWSPRPRRAGAAAVESGLCRYVGRRRC